MLEKSFRIDGNEYSLLQRMGNSYSSEVFKIVSKETEYVMKISYDEFCYKTERKILDELQKQNFRSPKIINNIVYEEKKALIMSFLSGVNAENIILTERIVKRIIETIQEFNSLQIDNKDITVYNFDTILKKFNNNMVIIAGYLTQTVFCEIQKQTDWLMGLLAKQNYDKLIHRDLRLGNILVEADEVYLIDFEGCAIGNPIMDLVKIYSELKLKNGELADYFLSEYLSLNHMQKDTVCELIDSYTIVDKINTIVWCVDRDRAGSIFFEDTIRDLECLLHKRKK